MVLQMRPHFIYNSMMAIYYLCKLDADKAQQVTLDFTTYLRRNFAAIASENTVPFKDELEHTRAYLALEQAQFEDRLFVSFDTKHTMFRVPPLTLQPLVENAVKHGMDPDGDPLSISV
ncbi:sensor histidine kinase, partial [uncultured Ruminococcus sp.]|uniref:sensor histidine kinase n=1 Tax=uncultured Ruminococcus sp. TaxID=165186 RepID=UPI0025D0DD4D